MFADRRFDDGHRMLQSWESLFAVHVVPARPWPPRRQTSFFVSLAWSPSGRPRRGHPCRIQPIPIPTIQGLTIDRTTLYVDGSRATYCTVSGDVR